MKKLSILAIALLLVSIIAVPVFAAQTASISVTASSNTISRGETVTVTVSTSEVANCEAGGFKFDFDTDVFEYVSGSAVLSADFTAGVSTANDLVAGYFMNGNATLQGDLFQITLKVKDTAAYGDYTISGTPSIVTKLNDVEEEVTCTVSDVTITVACKHVNDKYTDNGDGTHTIACSVCGTVANAAEAHTDENSDNTCDTCAASLVKTDATLTFYRSNASGGDLMLGDDIRASFIVKKPAYEEVYLEITMNGTTTYAYPNAQSNSTWLRFAYVVPAPRMTENISLTIWGVNNGEAYRGETLNFTVRQCAEVKLGTWFPNYDSNPAMAKQCDLLINMLHYGAEAQRQFTINTDNLATDGLSSEQKGKIKGTDVEMSGYPTIDETGKAAAFYNMGMMLQEKVKLVGILKITSGFTAAEDYTVEIQHTRSKDGVVTKYTIGSDGFKVTGTTTKYLRFEFDKLAPSQLRDDLTFTLYQNGVAVSATYSRSVSMVACESLKTYPTLIPAIMNYADCAKAVFG